MIRADSINPPTAGQKTEFQTQFFWTGGLSYSGGYIPAADVAASSSAAAGGSASYGAIWPGWGSLLRGSYSTYRVMLRHSTIAYAVSQILGPLLGSTWNVDFEPGAPEAAIEWVRQNIVAHRACIMPHALRSIVYGNSPFEVVWRAGVTGGVGVETGARFSISEYVPLLQDITRIRRGDSGRGPFTGLENGQAKLAPAECLYIINGSDVMGAEPGDDYGRARLENIRDTSWVGWLDSARRLAELEDRVSGVVPLIYVPHGVPDPNDLDADGNPKTYAWYASRLLPDLCHPRSRGAVLEKPAPSQVDASTDPGRLKQLGTEVDKLDLGQRGESQRQMLAKMEYWDRMIGRGLYRGERTLFATEGGTKADSGQHTQNAEPDEEAIDNMIAEHINRGPARTGLTLNFGPEILKKVRGIKPAPLVDRERIAAHELIRLMLQNTQTAPEVLPFVDGDKLFGLGGVPFIGKWVEVMSAMTQRREAAAKARTASPFGNMPIDGGEDAQDKPGNNGNDQRVKAMMKRLGRRISR